jgi:hypothetical protein
MIRVIRRDTHISEIRKLTVLDAVGIPLGA